MCEQKQEFKYLPLLSVVVLIICGILLIVAASCADEGMIAYEIADYWGSGYDLDGSIGWDMASFTSHISDPTGYLDPCTDSGTAVGAFSIIGFIFIVISSIVFVYFRMFRKNEGQMFNSVYQRHVFLVTCIVWLILLLIPSLVFYSECGDLLDDIGMSDVGPDYGLVVLWIACLALLVLIVLNSGMYAWSEEMPTEPGQAYVPKVATAAPSHKQYSNVPTVDTEQRGGEPVPPRITPPVITRPAAEQVPLRQEQPERSHSSPPPPPFNADLAPRNEY